MASTLQRQKANPPQNEVLCPFNFFSLTSGSYPHHKSQGKAIFRQSTEEPATQKKPHSRDNTCSLPEKGLSLCLWTARSQGRVRALPAQPVAQHHQPRKQATLTLIHQLLGSARTGQDATAVGNHLPPQGVHSHGF